MRVESSYGQLMLSNKRPLVHKVFFGKDMKKGRMTYGFGRGAMCNQVTRPFNYYMHKITRFLHNTLYYRRSEFNLNSSDLSNEFNHCSMLLYYANKHLKKTARMGFHTDCTYNHCGFYVEKLNGQKQKTLLQL